jgi:hypothetical protein
MTKREQAQSQIRMTLLREGQKTYLSKAEWDFILDIFTGLEWDR